MFNYVILYKLKNKHLLTYLLMYENKIDIAMITEVKPKYSVTAIATQQLKVEGYDLFTDIEEDDALGLNKKNLCLG